MKRNILSLALLAVISLSSCLKEHDTNVSTENFTSDQVALQFLKEGGTTINSGLSYFGGAALTYPPTSVSQKEVFNVSYNGHGALKSDLAVTISVDPAKVLDNLAGDKIQYELMPASMYSLPATNVTIPAGARTAPVEITFFPEKFDPTKSYMLPVKIASTSAGTISGNFGVIYFHVIGNPLAGVYDVNGTRYNYNGSSGYAGGAIPAGYANTAASPNPKTAKPNSTTEVSMDYANLGSSDYHYLITYDETKPNEVAVTGDFLTAVANFKVWVHTYDPATKTIHIITSYTNASGFDRVIDETFKHR